MDNISSALKISFAIFAFVIALSIATSCIGRAKKTADAVLKYADKTEYYEYMAGANEYANGRTVGIDTIISNLHRCYKEYFAVKVITGSNIELFDLENTTLATLMEKIIDFERNNINNINKYKENLIEVTNSGEYVEADDGTQLTVTPGAKKIYLIYEKI